MKKTLFTLIIIATALTGFAQVAVNTDGTNPNGSAMLDVKSTDKGLLIPRMTAAQRDAISTPAQGLMVFVTDDNSFYYYDGSTWQAVGRGTSGWDMNSSIVYADSTHPVVIGNTTTAGTFEVVTDKATGTYTTDRCTGGTASALEYQASYVPAHAFDDDQFSLWRNNGSMPVWIQYDLGGGNEKAIARYRLYWAGADLGFTPQDWQFQASNDGTSWTTLDSRTGETWTNGVWKEFTLSNITHYRYYRVNITQNNGASNNGVYLDEIEMQEMIYSNHPTLFVADNKVGIGTESPAATLDVKGSLKYADGTQSTGNILTTDADGNATWANGDTLNVAGWTKSGDTIYNTTANVGIGTSTPNAKLNIYNSSADTAVSIVNSSSSSTDHYGNYTELGGTGTGTQYGAEQYITNSGSGKHYGTYNHLIGAGTGTQYGTYQYIDNSGNSTHYGTYNQLTGTGTGTQNGNYQVINNSGNGYHIGTINELSGTGAGTQYGAEQYITNSGSGKHYGTYNQLTGTGTGGQYGSYNSIDNLGGSFHVGTYNQLIGAGIGTQYGTYQYIDNSGNNTHYGTYNQLIGAGTGMQYGTYQSIDNSGNGIHYGTYNQLTGTGTGTQNGNYQLINNSGNGYHIGTINDLSGAGTGRQFGAEQYITNSGNNTHYGIYNQLSGTGTGTQYGTSQNIDNTGNGIHYGINNELTGTGTGKKYGTYDTITTAAGGIHYGVYSVAEGTYNYAGYFKGNVFAQDNVGIGTDSPDKKLDVRGDVQIKNTTGAASLTLDGASGNSSIVFTKSGAFGGSMGYNSDLDYLFFYNGGNVVVKNGKLGVGTTTPIAKLEIQNSSSDTSLYITNSSNGLFVYGSLINLTGTANGMIIGTDNYISNTGGALHIGIYNTLYGTGTGEQIGAYQTIMNSGSGSHYGTQNILTGEASGTQYGSYQDIHVSGNGTQYGDVNVLSEYGGTGDKFGTYDSIATPSGGTHYGVYSVAEGSTNYAGYFKGNVEVSEKLKAPVSGDADMKAYIYGSLKDDGTTYTGESSTGFTSVKESTGIYKITFDDYNSDKAYIVVANALSTIPVMLTYEKDFGFFRIRTWGFSGYKQDTYLNFVVYKK